MTLRSLVAQIGVIDSEHEEYLRFHLEVVECRCCQASLQDLRDQHSAAEEEVIGLDMSEHGSYGYPEVFESRDKASKV